MNHLISLKGIANWDHTGAGRTKIVRVTEHRTVCSCVLYYTNGENSRTDAVPFVVLMNDRDISVSPRRDTSRTIYYYPLLSSSGLFHTLLISTAPYNTARAPANKAAGGSW